MGLYRIFGWTIFNVNKVCLVENGWGGRGGKTCGFVLGQDIWAFFVNNLSNMSFLSEGRKLVWEKNQI